MSAPTDAPRPPGWAVPLHLSVAEPVLLMGMPRNAAILLLMLTFIITLPLELWFLGIPFGLAGWWVGSRMTRIDPYWFELGRVHLRQPSRFELK